jgi:hypothetical protein
MASAAPEPSRSGLNLRSVGRAVRDMNRDYHWPSKVVLTVLVVACLLGAAITGWPRGTAHWPGPLRALGSGDMETLLALILALLVAVRFYQRADAGTLDGDEHYNVARALAFGYFKNFLVPALRLADHDDEQLYVFCPRSMDDLSAYSTEIEPRVRSLFDHDWQPVVPQPEHGAPRRTVLVVRRRREPITTGAGPSAPFMFDAPTALFTVQDFYAALNRRRVDDGAEPLSQQNVLRYQNQQIDSFFRHLALLFQSDYGWPAVSDLVATPTALAQLHARLHLAAADDIRRWYPATPEPNGKTP